MSYEDQLVSLELGLQLKRYGYPTAITSDEIYALLPDGVSVMKWKGGYSVKSPNEWDRQLKNVKLVDALAEMLIWLHDNKKVTNE